MPAPAMRMWGFVIFRTIHETFSGHTLAGFSRMSEG
jgi:hypothetical protein